MRAEDYDFIEIRAQPYAASGSGSGFPHCRCRSIPLCGTPLAVLLSLALFKEVFL
jgi:hypothetical protein